MSVMLSNKIFLKTWRGGGHENGAQENVFVKLIERLYNDSSPCKKLKR
jgi:hypothetical protein